MVEANELNSSHTIDNGGVFANENYPVELQPRDRTRADMQAQLTSMSNNLNPADLMEARDVNQGAPVIRNDGVVLNGNGRTAAIRSAYENLFGLSEEPAPLIDLIKSAREETENAGNVPMFSKQGEVDTRIDNIVEEKDLTPAQKLATSN